MTVTPADGASRPNAPPTDTAIGTVTISGEAAPADSTIETYTVAISGDATSLTYAWSVSGAGAASGGSTGSTFSVAYTGTTDASTVTCVVTSGDATATDSPATGSTCYCYSNRLTTEAISHSISSAPDKYSCPMTHLYVVG